LSSLPNQNEPIKDNISKPNIELVHRYGPGKWIPDKILEELAIQKYNKNGKGLTINDLIQTFHIHQKKAQRRFKNAIKEKVTKQGKRHPLLFTLDNNKPQQYYPTKIKADIIEKRKRQNRPIDPTGVSLYQSPYLERLKARSVSELLSLLLHQHISIHKIHLKLVIDKRYYDEIVVNQVTKRNKSKSFEEKIGLRNVKYYINSNGTVMIYIRCSNTPFKLAVEEDVSSFFAFLGQVKDRLVYFLKDFFERAIPPVMDWILVQCDINQDIGINIIEELSLPDLQLHIYDRIFRLYVKNINGSSYYRMEESKQVNQYVKYAIPEIRNMHNLIDNDAYDPIKFRYIQ
jgi:hypothetical protein